MSNLFTKERDNLNDELITSGIPEEISNVISYKIDRHKFIPKTVTNENGKSSLTYHPKSYANHPLSIGSGQTISQPYIVGLMINLLDLDLLPDNPDIKILEIGTGLGYNASVISVLLPKVNIYTLENQLKLCERAKKINRELGNYNNVHIYCQDGYEGLESEAPFDRIIVTAEISNRDLKAYLLGQLKVGGILVAPVSEMEPIEPNAMKKPTFLKTYKNINGEIRVTKNIAVRFVPFIREVKK